MAMQQLMIRLHSDLINKIDAYIKLISNKEENRTQYLRRAIINQMKKDRLI